MPNSAPPFTAHLGSECLHPGAALHPLGAGVARRHAVYLVQAGVCEAKSPRPAAPKLGGVETCMDRIALCILRVGNF
jgi:hypothetical protein